MQHNPEYEGIKPGREHASWLDESSGRRETAADADQPLPRRSEP